MLQNGPSAGYVAVFLWMEEHLQDWPPPLDDGAREDGVGAARGLAGEDVQVQSSPGGGVTTHLVGGTGTTAGSIVIMSSYGPSWG